MNSKTTPQFSLKDLHDWKSGHHHPPVEDPEDFERLAATIRALAVAEKERDEARADLARVAANRGELVLVVARTVEERDALKAALREMVECGEGCPACGDGTQGGCGCRYERAREALKGGE